jgi:hypothetical protein
MAETIRQEVARRVAAEPNIANQLTARDEAGKPLVHPNLIALLKWQLDNSDCGVMIVALWRKVGPEGVHTHPNGLAFDGWPGNGDLPRFAAALARNPFVQSVGLTSTPPSLAEFFSTVNWPVPTYAMKGKPHWHVQAVCGPECRRGKHTG